MKTIILTENAPAPIGPYSQAVMAGNMLYASGQLAFDPKTMELVLDNITAETTQVMENIKAVLTAADMTFENIVKVQIFLADLNDFAAVNSVYATYFNEATAPARDTFQVAQLPRNVNVEISITALKF
jgi:2-iminobutanoate/2-iminopropanoate deaminase